MKPMKNIFPANIPIKTAIDPILMTFLSAMTPPNTLNNFKEPMKINMENGIRLWYKNLASIWLDTIQIGVLAAIVIVGALVYAARRRKAR